MGVFVNIEALEKYPNQFMWLLDNIWSAMRTDQIVETTSLKQLNDGVSICVCLCVFVCVCVCVCVRVCVCVCLCA